MTAVRSVEKLESRSTRVRPFFNFLITITMQQWHGKSRAYISEHNEFLTFEGAAEVGNNNQLLLADAYLITVQEEIVSAGLLFRVLQRVLLVDPRSVVFGVPPERNLKLLQELVHALEQGLRSASFRFDRGHALEDDDSVRQISGHDEIVLDDETGLFGVQDEAFQHLGSDQTLFGIEISRGFVDQVDVRRFAQAERQGGSLQFTSGQILNLLVHDVVHFEGSHNVGNELGHLVRIAYPIVEQLAYRALRLGGYFLRFVTDIQRRDIH